MHSESWITSSLVSILTVTQVVPDSSSFLNCRDSERNYMIAENHMNMCKFKGGSDPSYTQFTAGLRQYLFDVSPARLSERGNSTQPENKSGEDHASNPIPGGTLHRNQMKVNIHPSSLTSNILKQQPATQNVPVNIEKSADQTGAYLPASIIVGVPH